MKKLTVILQPFMEIIFGALLMLSYLNYISAVGNNTKLAIGIVAMVLAAFYFFVGLFGVLGGKLFGTGKKVMDAITISAFPLFMFVVYLLFLINDVKAFTEAETPFPAGGWFIGIISLIGAVGFGVLYVVSCFVRTKVIKRLARLFGLIFVLVLLLKILFNNYGSPVKLGEVTILLVVIDLAYCNMMFAAFPQKEKAKKVEEKKAEEEKPSEEPAQEK